MIASPPARRRDRGAAYLHLDGELDLASAPTWLARARRLHDDAPFPCLVVDLESVTFADARGLGLLIGLRNDATAAGRQFRVVNLPPRVHRLLDVTGLATTFPDTADR